MTSTELFNQLKESDFSFTKPSFPKERPWHEKQKESMDKLIACGLAEKIGQNKYSLTTDGRKASVIGLEKWAKSLTDISKREFVYDCFGFFDSWYNLPRLKMILERSTKSTISKEMWFIIKAIIVALILYLIKVTFKIEL
ncbi:hypothetical protein [Algibacter sp. L3A6]|uniref:hypothetical protein n=1 Tax=Algibacter sp. L3A6 TaxID=2686366 RepID=UPI00131C66F6|nr:hypothetical protein [Algibacter sp. L3A6]